MSEELFKGYVHAVMATAVGMMAGYNAMRYAATGQRRNLVNLTIYLPLLVHEWRQASYHFRQCER